MTEHSAHAEVQTLSKGKLAQSIETRTHRLISDEPVELGGEDKGATPEELLASALGSCKSMTMQLYAKRKGWKLDRAHVTVLMSGEREAKKFAVQISLEGDLSPEERKRLLEIADRCPIHRILTGEVQIHSELV